MVGSVAGAALVAKVAFVALLVLGVAWDQLSPRAAKIYALLGTAAWFGLPFVLGGALVTPVMAALDVALTLSVFKGRSG